MYKVKFRTNLDCPKGFWSFPEEVICIPEIGHYVESRNGPTLKVYSITHKMDQYSSPFLEIYLTNL